MIFTSHAGSGSETTQTFRPQIELRYNGAKSRYLMGVVTFRPHTSN